MKFTSLKIAAGKIVVPRKDEKADTAAKRAGEKKVTMPTGPEFESAVHMAVECQIRDGNLPRKEMMKVLGLKSNKRFDEIIKSPEFATIMAYHRLNRMAAAMPQMYSVWACYKEVGIKMARLAMYKITQQELGLLDPKECLSLKEIISFSKNFSTLVIESEDRLLREIQAATGNNALTIEQMTEKSLESIEDAEDQARVVEALSQSLARIAGQIALPAAGETTTASEFIEELENEADSVVGHRANKPTMKNLYQTMQKEGDADE